MDKLSLIIPIYKSEMNIQHAYEEVKRILFSQSEFETELIFVNDGSPDRSLDLIKEIEKNENTQNIIVNEDDITNH